MWGGTPQDPLAVVACMATCARMYDASSTTRRGDRRRSRGTKDPGAGDVRRASPRPLSIVIAEPDRVLRTHVSALVRRALPDASLRFASDARSVLALVAAQVPDAVLLGAKLSLPDTLALCGQLRALSSAMAIGLVGGSPGLDPQLAALGVGAIALTDAPSPALVTSLRALIRHAPRAVPRATPAAPVAPAAPVRKTQPRFEAAPSPKGLVREPVGPGDTVGERYILEERLGEGGMGKVFIARHIDLGKRFALKVLSPESSADETARERFLHEAKLASRLSHPNIVSVVDFGHDRRAGLFMVMELLSGEPLSRSIGSISIRRACDLLGQIADALSALHQQDVIHGDLKPDNVMIVDEPSGVRRRRVARLIDFGLARRVSQGPGPVIVAGTPEYLAPERIAGGPATVATDVYALGVVAYELLTGGLPFRGTIEEVMAAHVSQEVPPLRTRQGHVDAALEALVLRAMEKDPANRHTSAAAFRYELNTVMNMLGQTRAPRLREDARLALVFSRSRLAQAIVDIDGSVRLANDAFTALVPDFARLVAGDAALAEALARARAEQTLVAYTAQRLALLLAPTDDGVHVVASPSRDAAR